MRKLVVIVEDGETIVALEIALASLNGITLLRFSSGLEAARFMATPPAELSALITDLNLPFFDGFQLVAVVRADPRYRELPIIVLSGDTHRETPSRLRGMGVNAFFAKPYSPALVRDTLEALLYVR